MVTQQAIQRHSSMHVSHVQGLLFHLSVAAVNIAAAQTLLSDTEYSEHRETAKEDTLTIQRGQPESSVLLLLVPYHERRWQRRGTPDPCK